MRRLLGLLRDERGATALEYGLICALVFCAALGAIQLFGAAVIRILSDVSDNCVRVL